MFGTASELCQASAELRVEAVGGGVLIAVTCFAGEDLRFQLAVKGSRVLALMYVGENVLGE